MAAGSIPEGPLRLFIYLILLAALWLGVDAEGKRNECNGNIIGRKGGRRVGLTTLLTSCTDCLKILGASTSWSPKRLLY